MVESTTVDEGTSYNSIIDIFDSIINHMYEYKSGVAYLKLNWKRSEHDDDLIETQVDIDYHCCDVNAIH